MCIDHIHRLLNKSPVIFCSLNKAKPRYPLISAVVWRCGCELVLSCSGVLVPALLSICPSICLSVPSRPTTLHHPAQSCPFVRLALSARAMGPDHQHRDSELGSPISGSHPSRFFHEPNPDSANFQVLNNYLTGRSCTTRASRGKAG